MIIFVICVLLCIGGMLYEFSDFGLDLGDVIMSTILGSIIGGAIYLFISLFIMFGLPTETITYNTDIYALRDNTSVTGSFFLGSGNVDSTMKYYYLTKSENGVTMNNINASSVIIVESFDKPHLEIQKTRIIDGFWKNQVAFNDIEPIIKTKIYIPKDSIEYGFSVDLK